MAVFEATNENNEEFLPAALEILERPPSPLGRIMALTIGAFFALTILWASFSKVDVIVSGQGKVIPTGQVKTIQPFETGVVTAIHVAEGQRVEEGDLLIELDPADTTANVENLKAQQDSAILDLAVAQALLTDDPATNFASPEDITQIQIDEAKAQMLAVANAYQSTLVELNAEEERLNSQIKASNLEIAKIDRVLPVMEQRVAATGTLLARDAMRADDRLALEQNLIETRSQRSQMVQSIAQNQAMINSVKAQQAQTVANFEATQRTDLRNAQNRIDDLEAQIIAEARRDKYRSLTAPVSGFIDQLTIHTLGGVVQPGQEVMKIVPDEMNQEIEAFILNKDIGFVKVDHPAEIKFEAFPFTRYGVLEGVVTKVSNDAIAHEQFGLVYKINAEITTSAEAIEETGITIGPGMNTTVEILTDQRRVIDYFISPILRYKDEAIRER